MARLTKEEKKKIIAQKKLLVVSKEKEFADISESAHEEWRNFCPCIVHKMKEIIDADGNKRIKKYSDFCPFLNENCHKTCCVAMKHRWFSGEFEFTGSFGYTNRVVSLLESGDTTGMLPGVADAAEMADRDEDSVSYASTLEDMSAEEFGDMDTDDYGDD